MLNIPSSGLSDYTSGMVRWLLHHILPAMGLVVITFVIYANALDNPFVIDDHDAIISHPHVTEPGGLMSLWTSDYWAGRATDDNLYRPLTVLSYTINHMATGLSSTAFRVFNLLALAAVALSITWRARWSMSLLSAWLVGLVVLTHPLNVEAINHIVGRADLLAMLGVLLFLLFHQIAINAGRWTWGVGLAASFSAALALGSKESGLMLVPLALAQLIVGRGPDTLRPDRRFISVAAFVVGGPVAVYLIMRVIAVGLLPSYSTVDPTLDLTTNPLRGLSFFERLPGAFAIHWHYLAQLVVPSTAWHHAPHEPPSFGQLDVWLGLLTLLALSGLTVWLLSRRHWLGVAGVMALAHYLIIGNLLIATGVFAANRLTLPFVVAMALTLGWLLDFGRERLGGTAYLLIAAVGLASLLSAGAVVDANTHWASHVDRMRRDAQLRPDNAVTHYLAAQAKLRPEDGRPVSYDELHNARLHLEQSLQLHDSYQATLDLALVYTRLDELAEARRMYERVLEDFPENIKAQMGVAYTAAAMGDQTTAAAMVTTLKQRDDLTELQRADMATIEGMLVGAENDAR